MNEKTVVVVSRKWHEPSVTIDVTREGISIAMTLADFLVALAEEVGAPITPAFIPALAESVGAPITPAFIPALAEELGSPALLFTKQTLLDRLHASAAIAAEGEPSFLERLRASAVLAAESEPPLLTRLQAGATAVTQAMKAETSRVM